MMTSNRRFMACCFGLAAWFSGAAGASAQEPQPTPQPDVAGSPALVQPPSNISWDTIEWIERRYKIEALRFTARHETGIGWWGSDEVMVGTHDAKGSTASDEIGGINSGDVHHFDPVRSCVLAVRPGIVVLGKTSVCDDAGEPAPLGFRVEFWEKDSRWSAGFCNPVPPGPGFHAGTHCANEGNGDDLIGRASIDLSAQELEAALPNVGDQHVQTVVLSACSTGDACGGEDLSDYSFTFHVMRLPDVRVGLRSVLDDAMHKIGARSELEAIAAGLRSLRAPSPRQIEPETAQ